MRFATDKNSHLILITLFALLSSCISHPDKGAVMHQFSTSQPLKQDTIWAVEADSIGIIEGLACSGNHLVVYDLHSGYCYTLVDAITGKYINRFGKIGQGPEELPRGCYGSLNEDKFTVFNDQTKMVIEFRLDSLRMGRTNASPLGLAKYDIPDAQVSRLIPVSDDCFLGAGTYKSRYQYVLFNEKNHVLDADIEIYNADDGSFDVYTRFLSNQGCLVKHPEGSLFAYSLNFSSNLDFIEIVEDKIKPIQLLRLGNPIYRPFSDGRIYSADITEETVFGYIDLCASKQYVYALYSDKSVYDGSRRASDIVLVYDWSGKAIKKYMLDAKAFHIAVDEEGKRLYASIKNEDGGWNIVSYIL